MMRLSAGASIAVHREDDAVANDDVAVPAPRQLALQSVQHPASLQPSAPHTSVSFAIQYFRRQSLVRQIGQMLNGKPPLPPDYARRTADILHSSYLMGHPHLCRVPHTVRSADSQ
jgi:hypothetical protein